MGFKEGLLALLAAGPNHGYALKLDFESATGGTWDLNVGQVYGALQRLEQEGCVELAGEADGRKSYGLTVAGRDRLAEWLTTETVAHSLSSRDELSMKVLLARCGDVASPRSVIAKQRHATMAVLQAHTATKAAAGSDAPLEQLVHLDRLILHCRAEVDWLDLIDQRLDDRDRLHAGTTGGGTQP